MPLDTCTSKFNRDSTRESLLYMNIVASPIIRC